MSPMFNLSHDHGHARQLLPQGGQAVLQNRLRKVRHPKYMPYFATLSNFSLSQDVWDKVLQMLQDDLAHRLGQKSKRTGKKSNSLKISSRGFSNKDAVDNFVAT